MTVKTITITQSAYDCIKSMKRGEESFSELFLRIGGRSLTIKDLAGVLHHNPEEAKSFRDKVWNARKESGKGLGGRVADVRSRLKRAH